MRKNVTRWLREAASMRTQLAVAKGARASICQQSDRSHSLYEVQELALMELFRQRRAKGLPVSSRWLRSQMRILVAAAAADAPGAVSFKASAGWMVCLPQTPPPHCTVVVCTARC
jgi:hypothetical protein